MNAFAVVVWLLNFGISFWNAYAVGNSWIEVKHQEGVWPKVLAWSGAVISALGFTWCYLILLAWLCYALEWVDQRTIEGAIWLGYLLLVPGILASGLVITLDSWARAYRNRRIQDIGIAAWNTYAEYHNTFHFIDNAGKAFKYVMSSGSSGKSDSKDSGGKGIVIMFLLVVVAALAGVITTAVIIIRVAGDYPMEPRYQEPGARPIPHLPPPIPEKVDASPT
jgi:hypothetical protein